MRFLVDAQLPYRLVNALAEFGHDTIHTLDLPDGNATSDREVASAADRDNRIVVTKDGGFRESHLLNGGATLRRPAPSYAGDAASSGRPPDHPSSRRPATHHPDHRQRRRAAVGYEDAIELD